VAIDGETGRGRKGGSVAIYVHCSLAAAALPIISGLNPINKMLWVKVIQVNDVVGFIGADQIQYIRHLI